MICASSVRTRCVLTEGRARLSWPRCSRRRRRTARVWRLHAPRIAAVWQLCTLHAKRCCMPLPPICCARGAQRARRCHLEGNASTAPRSQEARCFTPRRSAILTISNPLALQSFTRLPLEWPRAESETERLTDCPRPRVRALPQWTCRYAEATLLQLCFLWLLIRPNRDRNKISRQTMDTFDASPACKDVEREGAHMLGNIHIPVEHTFRRASGRAAWQQPTPQQEFSKRWPCVATGS